MENHTTLRNSTAIARRRVKSVALIAWSVVLLSSPLARASENTFAFTVRITLSPKAAATLASTSEGMVVSATYSGDPRPAAAK